MTKNVMTFAEKYLQMVFKKQKLIPDNTLKEKDKGVEIYGTKSVIVLVKEKEDGVHYNLVANK